MVSHTVVNKGYRDLNPVHAGHERCAPRHAWGPAVRRYWLLHFVVEGRGIFEIGGKRYEVKKGSFFVIPPHVVTYYEADATAPWEYIWVGFECEKLPISLDTVVVCPAAGRIFEDIRRCGEWQGGRTELLCARLYELFALLMEREHNREDYIDRALSIIHAEYMYDLGVQDIAVRLGLERTYFSVLFKKRVGVSPVQYLKELRLTRAAALLAEGKSPTVAARSVGYADIYLFSKTFKRRFGCSPRAFAKGERAEYDGKDTGGKV